MLHALIERERDLQGCVKINERKKERVLKNLRSRPIGGKARLPLLRWSFNIKKRWRIFFVVVAPWIAERET